MGTWAGLQSNRTNDLLRFSPRRKQSTGVEKGQSGANVDVVDIGLAAKFTDTPDEIGLVRPPQSGSRHTAFVTRHRFLGNSIHYGEILKPPQYQPLAAMTVAFGPAVVSEQGDAETAYQSIKASGTGQGAMKGRIGGDTRKSGLSAGGDQTPAPEAQRTGSKCETRGFPGMYRSYQSGSSASTWQVMAMPSRHSMQRKACQVGQLLRPQARPGGRLMRVIRWTTNTPAGGRSALRQPPKAPANGLSMKCSQQNRYGESSGQVLFATGRGQAVLARTPLHLYSVFERSRTQPRIRLSCRPQACHF